MAGMGYACTKPNENLTEQVRIDHNLETGFITGIKITGDPCIAAGEQTFFGDYDGKTSSFVLFFMLRGPKSIILNVSDARNVSVINDKLFIVTVTDEHRLRFDKLE